MATALKMLPTPPNHIKTRSLLEPALPFSILKIPQNDARAVLHFLPFGAGVGVIVVVVKVVVVVAVIVVVAGADRGAPTNSLLPAVVDQFLQYHAGASPPLHFKYHFVAHFHTRWGKGSI